MCHYAAVAGKGFHHNLTQFVNDFNRETFGIDAGGDDHVEVQCLCTELGLGNKSDAVAARAVGRDGEVIEIYVEFAANLFPSFGADFYVAYLDTFAFGLEADSE